MQTFIGRIFDKINLLLIFIHCILHRYINGQGSLKKQPEGGGGYAKFVATTFSADLDGKVQTKVIHFEGGEKMFPIFQNGGRHPNLETFYPVLRNGRMLAIFG